MESGFFSILILLIMFAGSIFIIWLILHLRKKEGHPIISNKVRVENKREIDTMIKGDDGEEVKFTNQYVTFLDERGATTEYKVPFYIYSNIEEGHSGVLRTQNNNFTSFTAEQK